MSQHPIRVQLSRRKGWRMPENTLKVDRSTPFGNPFPIAFAMEWLHIDEGEAREQTITWFADWLDHKLDAEGRDVRPDLSLLRGKNVACWCRLNLPCHGDILLDRANRPVCDEVEVPQRSVDIGDKGHE